MRIREIALVLAAFLLAFAVGLAVAVYASAAEGPDALTACQSDLAVTGQYALGITRSRTMVEQDLARAQAQIVQLQQELAAAKKPAEQKQEPKK